jgi:16S rRNA processing protein RimM
VVVVSETDNPDRFRPKARLRTDQGEFPSLVVTHMARSSKGALLLRFAGVTDRERAEAMVGASLLVSSSDRRRLDDGEFWPDELVGLEVRADGAVVGTVAEVILEPQTRLVVAVPDESRFQIPFVADLVPVVDIGAGYLEIVLLEGLITPR